MLHKPALPVPFTLILLAGGAICFFASLATAGDPGLPHLLRFLPPLAVLGLVVVSLVERLKSAKWDFPARVETAVHTAAASALCIFTSLVGVPKEWDSFRLLLAASFVFLLLGTVAILLPTWPRKVMLTCWIFWHFSGMFAVFASIDPPNGSGSWLAKQAWTFAFRPYLQFLYLTNAYHFYSPDPGPPTLLWFSVEYEGGYRRWIKIPSRSKSPIGMHYQRLLSLPEHSFNAQQVISPPRNWQEVYADRYSASRKEWKSKLNGKPIPVVNDLDWTRQYREPTEVSRKVIGSVCKNVLASAPELRDAKDKPILNGEGEPAKALRVKAYRVVHLTLSPLELQKGLDPFDKSKYWAYYLGEHDRKGEHLDYGELKDTPLGKKMVGGDPFLYWYLPLAYVKADYPANHHSQWDQNDPNPPYIISAYAAPLEPAKRKKDGWVMLDCLEMHAAGMVFPGMKEKKE